MIKTYCHSLVDVHATNRKLLVYQMPTSHARPCKLNQKLKVSFT